MEWARWDAVDEYFAGLLLPDDPEVDRAGLRPHDVSPLQARLLELLVRLSGAKRVLELGTLAGYSTTFLARGLAAGGKVVTLEADPRAARIARANLAGLPVEVVEGPALETLPGLGLEPFDLIFIDADKASNPAYLEWSLRLARPGTLIVADNVVREGAVLEGEDPSATGVRRFTELVAAEPRLLATALQTVGVKGWDGLLLALVTG